MVAPTLQAATAGHLVEWAITDIMAVLEEGEVFTEGAREVRMQRAAEAAVDPRT